MGITKRRMEADDDDINSELRICIRCSERIEFPDEDTISWRYEHSIVGPFTTIWVCVECKPRSLKSCVVCKDKPTIETSIPVCENCLTTYEAEIQERAMAAICDRCGATVQAPELEIYFDSRLCGWCSHMERKLLDEDRDWTPEDRLQVEERRIILPDEFNRTQLSLITDPRLIRHLSSNPEQIRSLSPRKFEELVADLLTGFGYKVTVGKGTKDGGVDVFAEKKTDCGIELSIVQCKRNSPENKVGEPVVKQLYADVITRNATRGLVVTTSTFTRDALKFIESLKYRLSPVDFDKLQTWLSGFEKPL